mmetsp:Transcript_13049/g.26114  ORF Transcript_13049/g.26114 Transcript_13049/m.26114 type:complete len:384 (+) Transcript_13049:206-1357(+)|eukprot:CAMPEP_0181326434 /NCGR_PEP_ID=MMETSP1101-20121128/21495_1 /TAXON_ID=46948 /ORGANISM="Rhodomonas abbreviata, Strain Caron Lab Isolate" /LENGTH=383 /DNA_ID=CAMNT_0023434885 /DNA_START=203 /DNA_END=1354 /DNA_ORIENTATION=+
MDQDCNPDTNKKEKGEKLLSLDQKLLQAASELDLSKIEDLIREGASVKYIDDPEGVWGSCNKRTALHNALSAMSKGSQNAVAVVMMLLKAGADVNAERAEYDWRGCGRTETAFEMLLRCRCLGKNPGLLEAFLEHGADPNSKQVSHQHSMRTDGMTSSTPLHTAVRRKDINSAGVLLRAGANVDHPYICRSNNERGYNQDLEETPLHIAVQTGSLEMLLLLLAEGADPNMLAKSIAHVPRMGPASRMEQSPTNDPREEGFLSEVRCVRVKESALHMALLKNRPDLVSALLVAGADREATRSYGNGEQSPTSLANGNEELLKALNTSSGWSPENHQFFASRLREQVRAVLLVAKAKGWQMPEDALFKIFSALTASVSTRGSVPT